MSKVVYPQITQITPINELESLEVRIRFRPE